MAEKKATKKEVKDARKEEAVGLWNQTGFHRPLGGFFYNYVLLLLVAVPGVLIVGIVLPIILPFPEALGYNAIVTALLSIFFILADLGMVEAITRYVGQHSTDNPKKALQYVSFFLWFQMISGLIQVTVVSLYVLTWLPLTSMNYASWFFLTYIMI